MKLSELVLLSDEEFDLVVNSILEGKTKNPFRAMESVKPIQAVRFERYCSKCLDPQATDGIIRGRVIA